MQIDIQKIKPSPYQPRMEFDLEDIRGSVEKDGIASPIIVRQVDIYYELIDGERRWRLAKELGWSVIPASIIEADNNKAMRLVWRLNIERKDYTPKEKAYHFRKMQQEGLSLREIGRTFGFTHHNVLQYLNVFKLPTEYQEAVWAGDIPIGNIKALEKFFNGGPWGPQDAVAWLDQRLSTLQLGAAINPSLVKFRESQVQKAQEAVGEIEPEIKLERPEDYSRAAAALKAKAKQLADELMTTEEKAEYEARKVANREARKAKAQETAQSLSLEEIDALAERVVGSNPEYAVHLKDRIAKHISRRERSREKPSAEAIIPAGNLRCEILLGDIRAWQDVGIEAGAIDTIITDPPYSKEFLPLFQHLANLSGYVLKEHGSLFVMVGQSYLPTIIEMLIKELSYHWAIAYLTLGGQSPQLWERKVNSFWKPVLWFTKGKYEGKWLGDVVKSNVNDNDKDFHEWGQSESGIADLIERATEPGQVILDPFMGGGTTGKIALSMGRGFVGIDNSQDTVNIAKRRLGIV